MKKLSIKDRAMAATASMGAQPGVAATSNPTPVELARKPKTGPGAMAAFLERESDVIHENRLIKEELKTWEGASPTRKLDPTKITPSRWANRHQDSFIGSEWNEFKVEIAAAGGNVQAIKVRPIPEPGAHEYEVVFGHRRHRACLELGVLVLATVESITDQALFEEMDRENRLRADLRPYEQGLMYKQAMDAGLYPSIRKMAESLGVDVGNVSKSLSLANLPQDVIGAFASPLDILLRWASNLNEALEKDPDAVIARAKKMRATNPRPAPKVVLEFLKTGVVPNNTPAPKKIEISGASGQSGSISLDLAAGSAVINLKNIAPAKLGQLKQLIQTFLV